MEVNNALLKIIERFFNDNLAPRSKNNLGGSALTSLLLEVFDQEARKMKPASLLRSFQENRFVQPGLLDPIESKRLEIEWLQTAKEDGFTPITLSPVAPLGSCSCLATVSQKKVLSSIRGTEVLADATNVLVLQIAKDFTVAPDRNAVIQYVTAHRHVRGQYFDNPDYTAHFSVFCLASGGWDKGNLQTEMLLIQRHLSILLKLIKEFAPPENILLKFYFKEENEKLRFAITKLLGDLHSVRVDFVDDFSNKYYQLVQYKIFVKVNGADIDFADGGLVDWTQKLLGNKKHRAVISGIGLELVQKLLMKKS